MSPAWGDGEEEKATLNGSEKWGGGKKKLLPLVECMLLLSFNICRIPVVIINSDFYNALKIKTFLEGVLETHQNDTYI